MDTPIVIVAETEEKMEEAVMRLARVGIETVKGFLENGIQAWENAGFETKTIEQVSVSDAEKRIAKTQNAQFIDVRRAGEYESGHAPRTVNLTLSSLEKSTSELNSDLPTFVICQGGYRSSASTSILEQKGFSKLYNISGGTAAWIEANLEIEKLAEAKTA